MELTTKGETTRRRIVDAALELFVDEGYEATTMRAVARRAGVSLGNAYYYVGSKEELVQGYYQRIQEEHARTVALALDGLGTLAERWRAYELAFLTVARPHHRFAGPFFALAAQPTSPLSPFSAESGPAREAALAIAHDVVEGARDRLDAQVRAELPRLLWLAHLGVTMHWVHDQSPDQQRTHALVDRTAPLIGRLAGLTRVPGVRGAVHDLLDVVGLLTAPAGGTSS